MITLHTLGMRGNVALSSAMTPASMLLLANGMEKPLRWDGLSSAAETAGMPSPEDPVTLTSSANAGAIAGELYAAARFVDRFGNLSNFTPISDPHTPSTVSGTISNATNTVPVTVTTVGNHSLTTGNIVNISGVEGTTVINNSWETTSLSLTQFSLVDSVGNGDYRGGGIVRRGTGTLTYGGLPVSSDPKVVSRQILRTKDGAPSVYYTDIETSDLTSTSLSSTNVDDDLVSAVPAIDLIGNDLAFFYYTQPPAHKAVVVIHGERSFWLVDKPYREGALLLTNGSSAVTGLGTQFTSDMVGRVLYAGGATIGYEIATVPSATSLTLGANYAGTTNPYQSRYAIRMPPEERKRAYYSPVGLPEAVSPSNAVSLPHDPLAGEVTGAFSMGGILYVTCEHRLYKWTYAKDPSTSGDGAIYFTAAIGAVNQRCIVLVDDIAYTLWRGGISAFAGNATDTLHNAIETMFRTGGKYSINWDASEWFHAAYSPDERTVRWWVAVGDSYTPTHAIVLSTVNRRITIERMSVPVGASAVGRYGPEMPVYLGSEAGQVYRSQGTADGLDPNSITATGSVSTVYPRSFIAASGCVLSSAVIGCPVVLSDGRGHQQERVICAVNTSTREVTVTVPWNFWPQDNESWIYQIGGIVWTYRTQRFRFGPSQANVKRTIGVLFSPSTSQQRMTGRIYHGVSESPIIRSDADREGLAGYTLTAGSPDADIDQTQADGFIQQVVDDHREGQAAGPRFMSAEFSGVQNTDPGVLYQIDIEGVTN